MDRGVVCDAEWTRLRWLVNSVAIAGKASHTTNAAELAAANGVWRAKDPNSLSDVRIWFVGPGAGEGPDMKREEGGGRSGCGWKEREGGFGRQLGAGSRSEKKSSRKALKQARNMKKK